MDVALLTDLAARAGIAGAFLLMIALWALHRGYWFPKSMVEQLLGRITDLQRDVKELQEEMRRTREECRTEVEVWEQRTFNALGVTDRLTKIAVERAARERERQER